MRACLPWIPTSLCAAPPVLRLILGCGDVVAGASGVGACLSVCSACSFTLLEFCALCTHSQFVNHLNNEGREENKTDFLSFYVSAHNFLRVCPRGMWGCRGEQSGRAPRPLGPAIRAVWVGEGDLEVAWERGALPGLERPSEGSPGRC